MMRNWDELHKQGRLNAAYSFLKVILPKDQHEEFDRLLEKALEQGWSHLGLWPHPAELPQASDLFGTPPNSNFSKFFIHTQQEKS